MIQLKNITKEQSKDTGLAIVLICLLFTYFSPYNLTVYAIITLFIAMAWPVLFSPLAIVWFGFSHVLGNIVSKVILTVIFLVLVTPVGLFRKILGRDSLRLKDWKKQPGTAFIIKNHTYTAKELERPY